MFARTHRVGKDNIAVVVKKRDNFHSTFFLVKRVPNELSFSRFVVVISKKIAKCAVTRNHHKRRVSAIIQQHSSLFTAGFDYLFYIRQNLDEINHQTLTQDILTIAKK
jgi:ribonuclease P protein component, eubacterial